ncbi:MAG: ABC transporter ATP-binding protein [Deltaproteobacteria bacterium]|nr:ABC transporter ATP-binding protein [Deltaproteobacteria bacterium]
MILCELKNVTIGYGKVEAVKGVSLNIREDEVIVVIGANGAGKSTVLRTISGLKKPISGEIWYSGKRIDGLPVHDVAKLGISHVPERRRLFPRLNVMNNLRLGAYLQKDKEGIKRNIEEIFEYFPVLLERKAQYAGTLSGGEQQMLTIGRALMSKPRLLLLDEPSLGLAPVVVKEMANIIKLIHSRGIPIILVEQNAQLALRLADRGYVLENGKVRLEGSSQELLTNELVVKAYLGG